MWEQQAILLGLCKVILINLVLSGDNAVVIALACRHLPADQQKKAYFWGSCGAVVLLTALTVIATSLLRIPYLQVAGGVLLISIARNLLKSDDAQGEIKQQTSLLGAIKTIIIADVIMSLDNTVAVAAAAKGDLLLIGVGLAVSIPLIIWGANLLTKLMDRFVVLVYAGAGLLAYSAGEMIMGDQVVGPYLQSLLGACDWLLPVGLVAFVLVSGLLQAQKVVTVRKYKRV
ncbi:MAG: TerC family protein [Tumebacillaceae bacterium]